MRSFATDPRVLIIGYGNTLRGDDGLGRVVAVELGHTMDPSVVRVIDCHQLTPDLSEPLSKARLAIFVDAREGSPPGDIECDKLTIESCNNSDLVHHLTPQRLLAISKALYGSKPEAYAFSVGGEEWGYCETLSPKVQAAVPVLIGWIERLIATTADHTIGACHA
ncbi:MAG TPA: hydrogenase maturation protease [Tepidisphaeraceae bacterium]|nr:hydrogenase maturation protease [Tepidisphaeraceae bacterium]